MKVTKASLLDYLQDKNKITQNKVTKIKKNKYRDEIFNTETVAYRLKRQPVKSSVKCVKYRGKRQISP